MNVVDPWEEDAAAAASSSASAPATTTAIVWNSSAISSSASANSMSSSTYEATKARQLTQYHADKIHWDPCYSHRDQNYRQLFHQRGIIGSFRIRLLEARNLKRSYWSALALGPVKHLGWSKAHGAVSSFCRFDLDFVHDNPQLTTTLGGGVDCWDQKQPAVKYSRSNSNSSSSSSKNNNNSNALFTSPVVQSNDYPVWENVQFECPLYKGQMRHDGQRVHLQIRVQEDATALENLLPGIPSGNDDARLLGMGSLDLTPLLLGEDTMTGRALPSVLDVWVPISLPKQQQEHQQELWNTHQKQQSILASPTASTSSSSSSAHSPFKTTKTDPLSSSSSHNNSKSQETVEEDDKKNKIMAVRVLVSYQPHGLEPEPNDVVALEAFARRNPGTSSCRPLIPPLLPLVVLERRGPFLLAEYSLPMDYSITAAAAAAAAATTATTNNDNNNTATSSSVIRKKAQVRLHRNAVFVIERFSGMDAAQNLALAPLDWVASTPVGQVTVRTLTPLALASRELFMPAMLSFKLLFLAARTTTLAGLSGFQALGQTLWQEGTGSLLPPSTSVNGANGGSDSNNHLAIASSSSSSLSSSSFRNRQRTERDRSSATAQFVAL